MDTEQNTGSENDLPLMSNTFDVLVRHFVLDLECSMVSKRLSGSVTLFLDLSKDGSNLQVFSIQEFQKHVLEKLRKESTLTDVSGNENRQEIQLENICSENVPKREESLCSTSLGRDGMSADLSQSLGEEQRKPFQFILDCCDLDIVKVEAVECAKTYKDWLQLFSLDLSDSADEFLQFSRQPPSRQLCYSKEKWCLKIWDPDVINPVDFAHCVRIHYTTRPDGTSLRWAMDQDGNPCVYTAGTWINNRSLMPCQEYGSLSTWQATIRVPLHLTVLMSGDTEGCTTIEGDTLAYYYRSMMPLPSFSLALAIGSWQHQVISSHRKLAENCNNCSEDVKELTSEQVHISDPSESLSSTDLTSKTGFPYLQKTCKHELTCQIPFCQTPVLPCRIFGAKSILPQAVAEFAEIFPRYSVAIQKLLGPFPFCRLDILIYPACSQDMAMSNPNLIFISQSMIAGDGSMQVNLGHELSHYWFGLLLGARDWTEEWLSEGFATFVEYLVEADVRNWSEEEHKEHEEIVDYLRYKTLVTELSHTNPELQTLCPNHERNSCDEEGSTSVNCIKNGMNPYKLFTQVHYLKGYFLLRWLTKRLGHDAMRQLLRAYIIQHHGRMVTSQDFLSMAFDHFPQLQQFHSIDELCHCWLGCPGLPSELSDCTPSASNRLYQSVLSDLCLWEKLDRRLKYGRGSTKRRRSTFQVSSLNSKQTLLLLSKLLDKRTLHKSTLAHLGRCYQLGSTNAEVQHRWFELVIKHKYTPAYQSLTSYLINHRAMGVYLYGEMVIARCARLKSIAENVFAEVSSAMEPTTKKIVQRMLYG